ncbi:hypothetical protein Cfla_1832 [Cellulomonas flavigena DSM 20109]|uniref:Pilus assembly protein PilO n=1 Tax=Cellulomonas flavigena (strain ATCC 482 / DSM 20109 / BCRC 11376 / JCM 18109 / NBRC 3775 / NCIMB 8073 / NRS 134) TaxID=446466 RepID=D5UER9_CELFN|nr:hypothetical protein [Cellulomonas flavigena]ADG74729.1 hypothetical protein Cfla_1832 [Cellulomonas flavigena DSM 20109]
MSESKNRTWILGTVLVALVMGALTWFFGVSPTLAAASDLRDQTDDARAQNDVLELQLVQLRADFEKLPEHRATLESLRTQIPTSPALAPYLRELEAIATGKGVALTTFTPSPAAEVVLAQPVVPAAPAAPVDATADATEPAAQGDATAAPAAPAAPAGPTVPAGMAAVPVSLTVVGTYDAATGFVSDLQSLTQRLFLVSGLSVTGQDEAEPSAGRPATQVGDVEIVVTGYLYVLPEPAGVVVPADPAEPPAALPGAVPGKNPFVPVQGV